MTLDRTHSPIKAGELAVVVGSGASGEAAVRLLLALGARVRLVDKDKSHISDSLLSALSDSKSEICTGDHNAAQFAGAQLVVVSPGVPLPSILPSIEALESEYPQTQSPKVIGELELALFFVKTPLIAVTGTSGKTTTVSLITAMLEQAGKKVFLGGNIGTPLSTFVLSEECADICVLECSSFQLQTAKSIHPKVAILLNLTENHLDQHNDMKEYVDAKLNIFANQTKEDLAILSSDLVSLYEEHAFSARVVTFTHTHIFTHSKLIGAHNDANANAAFLACQEFGVTKEDAAIAVENFSPIRHRLEMVDTVNGICFVNDSKGTTVEALRVALESFTAPVWLLAGGKFKGGDLDSLKPLLKERVKEVALFGASRHYFEQSWQGVVPISYHETMTEVFSLIWEKAKEGDVVLLSPATASYDQYKNYLERGDHFCRLVKEGKTC